MKSIISLWFLLLLTGITCRGQSVEFQEPVYFADSAFHSPVSNVIAQDKSGNTYVATYSELGHIKLGGQFYGPADSLGRGFLIRYDPTGLVVWVKSFTGVRFWDIEVDNANSLVALARIADTVTVEGVTLAAGFPNIDFVLAKWNSAGVFQWAKNGTGPGRRFAERLVIDDSDNIYTTGYFQSQAAGFGPFTLAHAFPTGFMEETAYCAKFNSNGIVQWAQALSHATSYTESYVMDVVVDPQNTIQLIVRFTGDVSWNNCAFTTGASFDRNYFKLKLNSFGQCIGAFPLALRHNNTIHYRISMEVDENDYLYVAGDFYYPADLGGITLVSPNSMNSFLARYDANGALQWGKKIGGSTITDWVSTYDLLRTPEGKLYTVGSYNGTISFGAHAAGPSDSADFFLAVHDPLTGQDITVLTGGGTGTDAISFISSAADGNYSMVAGTSSPVIGFGGQTLTLGTQRQPAAVAIKVTEPYNTITGTVFIDSNSNGTQDAGESAYRDGLIVSTTSGNSIVSTGRNGSYSMEVGMGIHMINIPNPPLHYSVVPQNPVPASFSSFGNTAAGYNFALQPVANQQDLRVYLTSSMPARPGLITEYRLTYRNVGTVVVPSGTVTFEFDGILNYLNSSQAAVLTGNTLSWNYVNLQPGEIRNIDITFLLPTAAPIGFPLYNTVTINPVIGDAVPGDNIGYFSNQITNTIAPNSKEVDYQQFSLMQVFAGEPLTYTIRFQNISNDTAFSVMLRDSLPASLLDLSSLQLMASSHLPIWSLSAEGILTVQFPNIKLPFQNVSATGSNGFVQFRVRPLTSISPGSAIENQARIHFDYKTPLITNLVTTVIDWGASGLPASSTKDQFTVWPNPASDKLHLTAKSQGVSQVSLCLKNISGQEVRRFKLIMEAGTVPEVLDVSGLSSGLYWLEMQTEKATWHQKVIIE